MKTILKITGFILIIAISIIACDNQASLQKYFVDSKENDAFISVDLPANILQLKKENANEDIRKTLQTIKKVNFLALQITDSNGEFYASEKEKVKQILKNPKYKQLMRMNMGNANVSINYLGEEESIDEVVFFGAEDEKGFAIIRVIGEKMNPSQIMKIAQDVKIDGDSSEMQQLEGLLSLMK